MNDDSLYSDLLDALYKTFGQHKGFRVTHAKGVNAAGVFTASPGAARVSRALHLQGQAVPVVVRFSNFSGIPWTPDGDAMASPRGLAVRFLMPGENSTDIVAHSFNGFPVATPFEFLVFLRGIASSVAEPADPVPLADFLAAHPRARDYLDTPKPAPSSYLTERYYGVNTFRFINSSGEETFGRYRFEPVIMGAASDVVDESMRSPDFLIEELTSRLGNGSARIRLMLQMPSLGDVLEDGSIGWPDSGFSARPEVELGFVSVDSVSPIADTRGVNALKIAFNPGSVVDGVEASSDPMIQARKRIYELAAQRRGMPSQ